ncbi:MAG: aldehyde dehydrogenase family protein, partial [Acidobacteriota bacterium]
MSSVLTASDSEQEIVSRNPATGEAIGIVRLHSSSEVTSAVEAARDAFATWKESTFSERARIVMNAREVIISEMDDIAALITNEVGKPMAEAISTEIVPALDLMQYFARSAKDMLKPKKVDIGLTALMGRTSRIIYRPLGVVGIIPAWNYPFTIPIGEAAMALMAGNTVVIKPSELTPLVGMRIAEIFRKAGLPDNVLQVITGDGSTGAAMVEAKPDKIMFTGSVATGKKVAQAAAK